MHFFVRKLCPPHLSSYSSRAPCAGAAELDKSKLLTLKTSSLKYDVILSNDVRLEELIGRNVRLDFIDLTVASNDPVRFPLVQKQFSKSSQDSDNGSNPEGESFLKFL